MFNLLLLTYAASLDEPRVLELIDKYNIEMQRVAKHILGNDADAEDAAQQAFLALIENFDSYRELDDDRIEATLFIITKRKAIDIYRKNRVRIHDSLESAEVINVRLENASPIADAISQLKHEDRDLILLRYDAGFSIDEIAKYIGTNYSTIQKRISRIKAKLREILNGEDYEI